MLGPAYYRHFRYRNITPMYQSGAGRGVRIRAASCKRSSLDGGLPPKSGGNDVRIRWLLVVVVWCVPSIIILRMGGRNAHIRKVVVVVLDAEMAQMNVKYHSFPFQKVRSQCEHIPMVFALCCDYVDSAMYHI